MVASVAVLSDVHGMLQALERVLAEPVVAAAELVVVTGDRTWGPQPAGAFCPRLLVSGTRAGGRHPARVPRTSSSLCGHGREATP